VFQRAEAVMRRVREYQPWRLAHIRRDIAGIVVKRYACRGAYFGDARIVMLELTFMANEQFSDSQVAACLIHEGMHARLDQLSRSTASRHFLKRALGTSESAGALSSTSATPCPTVLR